MRVGRVWREGGWRVRQGPRTSVEVDCRSGGDSQCPPRVSGTCVHQQKETTAPRNSGLNEQGAELCCWGTLLFAGMLECSLSPLVTLPLWE